MATFRVLKGSTDAERMVSADGMLESLNRKVAGLERQVSQGAMAPFALRAEMDEIKGTLAAILKHLGLTAQPNTTTHDLVPAEGQDSQA